MTLLRIYDLTMRFGGLTAVNAVSLSAQAGKITSVIGPNGAGKTTLFNCVTGFYRPSSGQVEMRGLRLDGMSSSHICRRARVARTFQNLRLFDGMTVLENLMVAQHSKLTRASLYGFGGLLGTKGWRRAEAAALARCSNLLQSVGLLSAADLSADSLPYGDRRRLEIARALATDPLLLCLDEPAAGLNPAESLSLNRLLLDIRDRLGVSILLIEHDMSVVMNISDHIVVLDYGSKIAEGSPSEIRGNARVIEAYLGS